MMNLRDYQSMLADKGKQILLEHNIVYLGMKFRVGKTAIALTIAERIKAKNVLLMTTRINIKGHQKDYKELGLQSKFKLTVQHYHHLNIKKLKPEYDLVICDEAQKLGAFPKPAKSTQALRDITIQGNCRLILMSATPTPESYSQIYHQLWLSMYSPFKQWPTFYKWAKAGFVNIFTRQVPGHMINDYSHADKNQIDKYIKPLFLTYTQEQAGFEVVDLDDQLVYVKSDPRLHKLVDILVKDRVYEFKDKETIIACENAASLHRKVHQIYSGTVICERDGKRASVVLDTAKVDYIKKHYYGKQKIAVFYLFQAEGDLLKETFKHWTDDPVEFNSTDKSVVFIGQFNASARGINLSSAKGLVFYNIPFSSEMYQQARQRGQAKDKKETTRLYWLCSEGGIEEKIYNRVINKQSYTLHYFSADYLTY